jgi:ubiquinone/menaquinone biosynthesis C-methylase UbiE
MAFHRDPESMKRFYDGFHPWYRFVEGNTGRSNAAALSVLDPDGSRFAQDSILEHCCGTGSLALEIAPRCASYAGRDQSEGMLGRASQRWNARFGTGTSAPFKSESVLDFADPSGSVDWVAISFALHLFPPADEEGILVSFLNAARKGAFVIEHSASFSPFLSLVEAVEGSWYESYKRIDFAAIAQRLGASFIEREIKGARVMEFLKEARKDVL